MACLPSYLVGLPISFMSGEFVSFLTAAFWSSWLSMNGVPQGSVLSPHFFFFISMTAQFIEKIMAVSILNVLKPNKSVQILSCHESIDIRTHTWLGIKKSSWIWCQENTGLHGYDKEDTVSSLLSFVLSLIIKNLMHQSSISLLVMEICCDLNPRRYIETVIKKLIKVCRFFTLDLCFVQSYSCCTKQRLGLTSGIVRTPGMAPPCPFHRCLGYFAALYLTGHRRLKGIIEPL